MLGYHTPQTRQTSPRTRQTPPDQADPPGSYTTITPPPDQADPLLDQADPPRSDIPPGKQTPAYGLRAAGTHPTGMHSCFIFMRSMFWEKICHKKQTRKRQNSWWCWWLWKSTKFFTSICVGCLLSSLLFLSKLCSSKFIIANSLPGITDKSHPYFISLRLQGASWRRNKNFMSLWSNDPLCLPNVMGCKFCTGVAFWRGMLHWATNANRFR